MWSLENDVILSAATHYMNNNKTRIPLRSKASSEPPQFYLPESDSYLVNCGQITLTANYLLVFHCSVCDNKYGTLFNFLQHFASKHQRLKKEIVPEEQKSTKETAEKNLESLGEYVLLEIDNDCEGIIEPKWDGESRTERDAKTGEFVLESDENKSVNEFDDINAPLMKDSDEPKTTNNKILRKCDQCDRVFSRKQNWSIHILSHSNVRPYICTLCGITVKHKQNLQKHMLRHTNQKNFKCELCEKQFFTRTEVKIHERMHTGERPYFCFKCGDSFKSTGNLSAHLKRHENVRTKKCETCGKCFIDMHQLKEHMAGHSNERPHACKYCPSTFSRRKTLQQHVKLHINAKEYECNLCEKSFNQRPALLSHMNNNHKALEYSKQKSKYKNGLF